MSQNHSNSRANLSFFIRTNPASVRLFFCFPVFRPYYFYPVYGYFPLFSFFGRIISALYTVIFPFSRFSAVLFLLCVRLFFQFLGFRPYYSQFVYGYFSSFSFFGRTGTKWRSFVPSGLIETSYWKYKNTLLL